jgi:hypothetical protein
MSRRLLPDPFARLVRHCVDRIFHGGETSEADGVDFGIGAILGLLALPGVFASLFLADKYGSLFQFIRGDRDFDPYTASLPDEYFFIALSMVVAAAVAVWKWDSLLPDRRDYVNLAPLPIRSRDFLAANLLALLFLTAVLSLDVNAASVVLFPVVVCGSQASFAYFVRFLGAHFLCVVLSSTFSFLVVLAALGALMAILPFRAFRKVSLYVRFAIITGLMAILSTSFAVPPLIHSLAAPSQAYLKLIPPVWFLALDRSLLGRADPALSSMGGWSLMATGVASACAIVAYALGYHRCFSRSSETMASLPTGGGFVAPRIFSLLDRFVLHNSFDRATFRFTMRALVRGPNQSLVVGWFAGVGIVIASQSLFAAVSAPSPVIARFPSADVLGVPLALAYFLILGLRCAFDVPASLRANWLFRLTVNPETRACAPLARKVTWVFLVPAVLLICFPLYAYFWGWRISLIHTGIVAAMCALLTEISLMRFRKIPFTCSAPTFKSHAIVAILIYIVGFFVFSAVPATVERWAFDDPVRFLAFVPLLAAAWLALREWRRSLSHLDTRIIFEEKSSPAVEAMNLTYGP